VLTLDAFETKLTKGLRKILHYIQKPVYLTANPLP